MFPTIAAYNQAIQTKGGNAFKSLSNLTFIPSRTVPVKIYSYGSGSYAVVFKAKGYFNEFAIRCFISAESENIDRYRNIDRFLKGIEASWITKIELLEDEINVDSQYYPVIKMDWVEGQLLNNFITQIVDDNSTLTELQKEIIKVSRSLETLKIGHGDIQCGNVIIVKNSNNKIVIKLIDYDGMYIPSFSNKINLERGRTEFQHPNRSQIQYNEKIDRFSFWVILCALEALKFDTTLWFEVMRGGFNTLDNLLFTGDDFKYFNQSKLVNRLYALNQPSLTFYLDNLKKFCNSGPDYVEPPMLFDSKVVLSNTFIDLNSNIISSNEKLEILSKPLGAAVLSSTFQCIGFTPLVLDKSKYIGKSLIISYSNQIRQIDITHSTSIIDIKFEEHLIPKNITESYVPLLQESVFVTPNVNPITSSSKASTKNKVLFFLIALFPLIAILVAFVVNYYKQSTDLNPLDQSYTNQLIDTTKVDTTAPSAYDTTAASPIAIINNEPDENITAFDTTYVPKEETPTNSSSIDTDDYNTTPQQVVKSFLYALSIKDYDFAWNLSNVPAWEEKGIGWFIIYSGFGGYSNLNLASVHTLNSGYLDQEVTVIYTMYDSKKLKRCFYKKFKIERLSTQEDKTKWYITEVTDITIPWNC